MRCIYLETLCVPIGFFLFHIEIDTDFVMINGVHNKFCVSEAFKKISDTDFVHTLYYVHNKICVRSSKIFLKFFWKIFWEMCRCRLYCNTSHPISFFQSPPHLANTNFIFSCLKIKFTYTWPPYPHPVPGFKVSRFINLSTSCLPLQHLVHTFRAFTSSLVFTLSFHFVAQ